MTVALVLGCNGQDGTFLCRRLLRRGYSVIGVGRQHEPRFSREIGFTYVACDLARGTAELARLLEAHRPELAFHVAAIHASSGLARYEGAFEQMLTVNVASVHTLLEYVRLHNPSARVLYASSAKVFGAPLPSCIDEETPRTSSCLYAVTKSAAGDTIRHYRRVHGCQASQLFLFNHESELRPASFFIPKLARMLAAGARGEVSCERFDSLDFHCDWGSADEYMGIAIDCLERAPAEDFVLATGRCLYARELVERLAAEYSVSTGGFEEAGSPRGQTSYQVDTAKLRASIGRTPSVEIEAIIRQLADRELERARGT